MSTALMTKLELDQLAELGTALRDSGYFADTKTVAQAAVKVLAGRELGLGPVESMRALHIVNGKVELSADLLAARVKMHPRYDYRIVTLNDAGCAIEFFQDGASLGVSDFMDADRERAKLTGATWTQYPRNMMFARAMSNGVAWYCPDVASGARLYVDGEIDVANEQAPIIEALEERAAAPTGALPSESAAERVGARHGPAADTSSPVAQVADHGEESATAGTVASTDTPESRVGEGASLGEAAGTDGALVDAPEVPPADPAGPISDPTLTAVLDRFHGVGKALAGVRKLGYDVKSCGELTEAEGQAILYPPTQSELAS